MYFSHRLLVIYTDFIVGTSTGQDTTMIASKGLSRLELKQKNDGSIAEDAILQAERKDFTMEGKEKIGFASSEVPTIEEKTMADGHPRFPRANSIISAHNHTDATPENFGKFDNTDVSRYILDTTIDDAADDYQQSNVDERDSSTSPIQKYQTIKPKIKWTVPIHRPRVDPAEFEDPISDVFWTDVWVASAAYNVRQSLVPS